MYVSISPGVKDSSLLILIKYKKVLSMPLCGQTKCTLCRLADAKADLTKDNQGEVDTYV